MKLESPGDQIIEAMHHALPGKRDEFHLALITRLEAHGIACRDVQPEAARCGPVKAQGGVRLKEVVVAPNLNRAIARVGHFQNKRGKAKIRL